MKKIFLTVLLTMITILSVFGLSSCDDECTHEWGEWSVSSPSTCVAQGTKQHKCSKCEKIQSENIDIADHKYDVENIVWNWNGYEFATATLSCITNSTHTRQINANVTDKIATAPTCTVAGTKTYTANVKIDGITYTTTKSETLAALGHTEVTDVAVTSTCKQTGLTEGSHCSVCKEVLVAQQETPKSNHTETKIEAVAATCSAEGATEGVECSVCSEILEAPQPTNKIPHTEETVPAIAATCSENGLTEGKKCSICDEVLVAQQPTNKLSHTETALLGIAPSCSEEGLTEGKKCSVCEMVTVAQKPIDKLPHTEETVVGTAPTCSATGLSDGKKCSVCKETLIAQTILPKVACDYESILTAPTCETQGYTTHICSTCGDNYIDSYENALGHSWGSWKANAVNTKTIRDCNNNCGEHQEIISVTAECTGDYYRLIGENVSSDDIILYALINDEEGSIIEIDDFTLGNTTMTLDGENNVIVKYYTIETVASVIAIPDNLSGTTSSTEFTWSFDENNNCYNLVGFTGSSTAVIIPAHINRIPVRNILSSAFEGNDNITALVIPSSIYTINSFSFKNCTALKALTLNEGLKTICGGAFQGCAIIELVIPNSVKTLEATYYGGDQGAFEDCTKLTSVAIGDGVKTIDIEVFRNCTALKTVVIGDSVETIGENAFSGCASLTSVTFGNSLITIGSRAFENCESLTKVTIPASVQTIDTFCFKNCTSLKALNLNEGLKTICGGAFQGCAITELTIPNSVKRLESTYYDGEQGAFEDCTKLASVVIGDGVKIIGNETFRNCTALKTVIISNGTECINERAFSGCSALSNVELVNGLITISSYAFENCTALTIITIPDSVQTIGEHAFEGCTLLANFNIGIGVQRIGAYALQNCSSLKSVAIPANVQVIGAGLFNNCSSLEEAIIEKGVLREVGSNVFNGCSSFDRMYYTGTASDWVLVAVSEDNSYPLNVSPYYYSSSSPSGKGNYWYYNNNGEIRVWNVSETSFKAEEYSEKFANSTFGSYKTSYSSQFLSQLEGDSLFQARLLIWEALHIATDSSWESKAISKKDVYKMVIYDLLVGEVDAQVNPLAGMDAGFNTYVYDFAKFLLGKDSLTKSELNQLKNLSPLDYDYIEMVDKYFKGIDVLKEVFKMSTNLYDALYVAAQYKALSDMDTNFYLVLTEISNDDSLPWDLRNAASECAECYRTATEALLKKIVVQEFASSTMEVLWKDFQDEAWKNVLESVFPQVKFADLTIKGAMFLANMGFNLDACNEAYYQLEAAVGLENALRNVIKNTLSDYLRYNYKDKSEYYMYAIDMYQTSVLLGFDYSNNLLREHSKSADINAEQKQAYENMMVQISSMKQEKATMYNNFESVIEQLYVAYYS